MFKLSALTLFATLAVALPVNAQSVNGDPVPAGEPINKKGMIEPTSKGSSGAPDVSAAGGGANEEADTPASETIPNTGGLGTNPGPDVNPYPNANSGTGMVNGGSVNGTGALTSAHPGH